MLPVIHDFWLRYVPMVTVGTLFLMYLLMHLVTEVVYSTMPLDESQNIFQSVIAKQSDQPLRYSTSGEQYLETSLILDIIDK